MFEPVVSAIMTLATVSGSPIGEQLGFGTLYFTPPGPQLNSVGHALSQNSIGANSAVISFDYSQDGGPLGSSPSDLNLEIHLPDGQVFELDPIPGAPSFPPFGTYRMESRRFFFDPVAENGPWTIIASQRSQSRTSLVELANVRMVTDQRPEPVVFERVRLNDGFIERQFGPHPYGLLSFRVDTTGDYQILADWRNIRPRPGHNESFNGDLYLLEGYYRGNMDNLLFEGEDLYPEPLVNQCIISRVILEAGQTYTMLCELGSHDENDQGYSATITITGDGTARETPMLSPRGAKRR